MTPLSLEESPSEVKLQPRKILIAVDLKEHSEKIIVYSLLVTQRIFCEYSVLYCLESGISEELAGRKIALLLAEIDTKYGYFANRSLKSIILDEKPSTAIEQLYQIHDYNCIMIGTSNQENSWELGTTSKSILLTIPTSIIVIPPKIELIFPNSISVLIEKKDKANFELLTAFNRFVSFDNIFINFVFFAKNTKIMDDEKALIEKYQRFFESNFTFAFIVEATPTYTNFFKYIEETYCMAAVIPWDENSIFFEALKERNFVNFPCSPKIPVLYSKKKEPIENIERELTPFVAYSPKVNNEDTPQSP